MATRRDFLKTVTGAAATALVGCGSSGDSTVTGGQPAPSTGGPTVPTRPPNILLMLVDEMRVPPTGYGPNEGEAPGLKEILGFTRTLSPDNPYTKFFPAFVRLRKNATVLRNHYCSSAACAPSRSTFITGQYPSLHGVTQVNGAFKFPDEIQFLDPNQVPTIGDWFRAAGYESHYFGKCHFANCANPPFTLDPFGFSSYNSSGPDPDSSIIGLPVYRDPGFADIITGFLQRKGSERDKPWFAVASLGNPHDTGAWPAPFNLPGTTGVTGPPSGKNTPQSIPPPGTISNTNANGVTVQLNPDGFPQETFNLPPTWNEDLSTKPQCHLDSAWKVQMALAAAFPPPYVDNVLPFPIQALQSPLREGWARAYGQFYMYIQYVVNLQLARILDTLDQVGLAEDTIIVFTSDHGTNNMAHNMMIQKFYTAYDEALKVPFVISSPRVNPGDQVVEFREPTTHVDLAPTLLGLAGLSDAEIAALKSKLTGKREVRDFVGLNLVPYLAQQTPLPRPGVIFTTADEPTLPADVPRPAGQSNFDNYKDRVQSLIDQGAPLFPGSCVEPNTVLMLRTAEWKYVRYTDDNNVEPDQFEMYYLVNDPNETRNLVDFRTGQLLPTAQVPGLSQAQLQAQLELLRAQLAAESQKVLLTPAVPV